MNILPRISVVLAGDPNEAQLDKFLGEVRDSLSGSNKQFITYSLLVIVALVTYHLVVYEGATGLSLNSVAISDTRLFRKVFLVVPAALLGAFASIGYLRRCQREVYDYLTISRYRILGATGLHELRIPPDYILGLALLRTEGGIVGKVISNVVALLSFVVFAVGPVVYITYASKQNITLFGFSDLLAVGSAVVAVVLALCSLVVVFIAGRVKAT
jgi:hypothetical protein